MQVQHSILHEMLTTVYRDTGTYTAMLLYSGDGAPQAGQSEPTVVFNNPSDAAINLSTKPVYFAVPAGKTVVSVWVFHGAIAVLYADLTTPEVYTDNGTFTLNDLTISISLA